MGNWGERSKAARIVTREDRADGFEEGCFLVGEEEEGEREGIILESVEGHIDCMLQKFA